MDKRTTTKQETKLHFPPVVAVLGHVDHGKTTLLDAIRKSSVANREFGGITQAIGASSVEIVFDGQKRRITFIDTPGHEAFSNMRSRGAQAADIGLLIVSSVDGVMPQTRESIQLLKEAEIPFIVVLTMSDLPGKNLEKVKQQIIRENIILEGYGGDVPVIDVSAKTDHNIRELLDLILLVSDMKGVNELADAEGQFKAIVIESKRDLRIGPKSTIIIKNGTIHIREELQCEGKVFRVRTVINDLGKPMQTATIGDGVELLGPEEVLPVGGIVTDKNIQFTAKDQPADFNSTEEFVYHKPKDSEGLTVIITADTQGSLEAILATLPKGITIVSSKTGEITENDVLRAKATNAIVLSFNTKIRSEVEKLAFVEKVLVKSYKIIYEMLDEIADVLEGKRQMNVEHILGKAKILARFPFEKTHAFGISLLEGRIARNDRVRIMRGENVIGETTIQSLRVGKNSESKVTKGEAGLVLAHDLDITIGDMILSVS